MEFHDLFERLEKNPLPTFTGIWLAIAIFFASKIDTESEYWYEIFSSCLLTSAILFSIFGIFFVSGRAAAKRKAKRAGTPFIPIPDSRPGRTTFLCLSASFLVALVFTIMPLTTRHFLPRVVSKASAKSRESTIPNPSSPAAKAGEQGSRAPGRTQATYPGSGNPGVASQYGTSPAPAVDESTEVVQPTQNGPVGALSNGVEQVRDAVGRISSAISGTGGTTEWVQIGRRIPGDNGFDQDAAPGAASFTSWRDVTAAVGSQRTFKVEEMLGKRCTGSDNPSNSGCQNIAFHGKRTAQAVKLDENQSIWIRVN